MKHHFAKYLGKEIWNVKTGRVVTLVGMREHFLIYFDETQETGIYPDFKLIVNLTEEIYQKFLPLDMCVNKKGIEKEGLDKFTFLDEIMRLTYKAAGVTENEIMKSINSRKRKYVEPRQVVMALYHKGHKNVTAEEAGSLYGKDHSTCLHAVKTVDNLLKVDIYFVKKYTDVLDFVVSVNPKIELSI